MQDDIYVIYNLVARRLSQQWGWWLLEPELHRGGGHCALQCWMLKLCMEDLPTSYNYYSAVTTINLQQQPVSGQAQWFLSTCQMPCVSGALRYVNYFTLNTFICIHTILDHTFTCGRRTLTKSRSAGHGHQSWASNLICFRQLWKVFQSFFFFHVF